MRRGIRIDSKFKHAVDARQSDVDVVVIPGGVCHSIAWHWIALQQFASTRNYIHRLVVQTSHPKAAIVVEAESIDSARRELMEHALVRDCPVSFYVENNHSVVFSFAHVKFRLVGIDHNSIRVPESRA